MITTQIHHYREQINGRPYVIEVQAVGRDRWRAQITSTPGARTALMPFYAPTPDEAAQRLAAWLIKVSPAR